MIQSWQKGCWHVVTPPESLNTVKAPFNLTVSDGHALFVQEAGMADQGTQQLSFSFLVLFLQLSKFL